MRNFDTGATRDGDDDKLDFEAFFSPIVLYRRAEYMHKHRRQADGKIRDGDNWQKGIPIPAYMKSGLRHTVDDWLRHRGYVARDDQEEAICAEMFNLEGRLLEILIKRNYMGAAKVHKRP